MCSSGLIKGLRLPANQPEIDSASSLLELIEAATRSPSAEPTLGQIHHALSLARGGDVSALDSLRAIPILLPCPDSSATDLVMLIGESSNPKELLIAVQEAVEAIESAFSSTPVDEVEEEENAPIEEHEDEAPTKTLVRRLADLIKLYSIVIPRLELRKRTPTETIHGLIHQANSALELAAGEATVADGRMIIAAVSELVRDVMAWVRSACPGSETEDEFQTCKGILGDMFDETVMNYASFIQSSLAHRTFHKYLPRYATPLQTDWEEGERVVRLAIEAAKALDLPITAETLTPNSTFTLTTLVLLAHSPSITPLPDPVHLLTSLLPVVQTSLQTNTAADESLALLFALLSPPPALTPSVSSTSTSRTLPPYFATALTPILVPLASTHSHAPTRHITFHVLRLVLARSPPLLHFQILAQLVGDEAAFVPPPMRVAVVGMVREAVVGALREASVRGSPVEGGAAGDVWASKEVLGQMGRALFRVHGLDGADEGLEREWEVKRLAECLSLVYIMLLSDTDNRTGIRSADTLESVEASLLAPIRSFVQNQITGQADADRGIGPEWVALQVGLERVNEAIERVHLKGS